MALEAAVRIRERQVEQERVPYLRGRMKGRVQDGDVWRWGGGVQRRGLELGVWDEDWEYPYCEKKTVSQAVSTEQE